MVIKKKAMPVLLVLLILLTSNIQVYANPVIADSEFVIQPRWDNTGLVTVTLSISNKGKAVLSTVIQGYTGVNEIMAEAILERKNSNGTYTEIECWDDISADDERLSWTGSRYVAKGYTYRFTLNATVYKKGVGEDISASKSASY